MISSMPLIDGNVTTSAGNLIASGQRRTIRIIGEIENPQDLENFVVKSENNNPIYLKDIATVSFKEKDKTTYARKVGEKVVMLDVKKASREKYGSCCRKLKDIVEDAKENYFPKES